MDFFSRGYSALKGDLGAPQSASDTINKLCSRLESATLLEDRRAAILGLKGLARQYKLEVSGAMDGIIMTLVRDRNDLDVSRATLETLNIICTRDRNDDPVDLSLLNTDRFLAVESNVAGLLNSLDDSDFYIRLNTLQCLATFQQHRPQLLQDRVLQSGLGVARLMDLLDDRRELLRNEALLLLIALTEHNSEIQKIVAFENAFDRLFQVIREEDGPISGGIVVQDCLQLVQNLLRYNTSNQNYFRETGGIQTAAAFIIIPASSAATWSEQAAANMTLLIDILRSLVSPDGSNAAVTSNQRVMGTCALPALLRLGLAAASNIPVVVQVHALYAIGDIVRRNKANQMVMHSFRVETESANGAPSDGLRSGFDAAVGIAVLGGPLDANANVAIRMAAAYVCECYLLENLADQLALAKLLCPPPVSTTEQDLPKTSGALIVYALTDADGWKRDSNRAWFAALILMRLFRGEAASDNKKAALNVMFGDTDQGEESVPFMHTMTHALSIAQRDSIDPKSSVAVLSLLCFWLHGSPSSVAQFLSEGINLQNLVEWSQLSNTDIIIQGLSAYLLGVIYEFDEDSSTPFPRASLQPILLGRIGADAFMSCIRRLRETKAFQQAPRHLRSSTNDDGMPIDLCFDPVFVEYFKDHSDSIQQAITIDPALPHSRRSKVPYSPQDSTFAPVPDVSEYETKIAQQTKEIARLQAELEKCVVPDPAAVAVPAPSISEPLASSNCTLCEAKDARLQGVEVELQETKERISAMEKEQEDLLVYLADQDQEMKRIRTRLRELGEEIPLSDEEGSDE